MSYSQGGLIQASDYNGFVGSNNTTSGTLNYVWSTGNGSYGYGQTGLAAVSQSGLVTATQWASLINTMNSIGLHQSNTGTGLSVPTSGTLISYLSAVSGDISTYNTNHLNAYTTGTKVTQSTVTPSTWVVSNAAAAQTQTYTRTITFANGDAARYFFNAGGSINFVIATASTADTGGTGGRSQDLVTLLNTNFGSLTGFNATSSGTRSGTGGTLTSTYSSGYYGLTTSPQTILQVTSGTSGYTNDYVSIAVSSNGTRGSNGDKGSVLTFTLTIYSAARTDGVANPNNGGSPVGSGSNYFNDDINLTTPNHLDYTPPETTNLSNTWGTITVA